MWELLHTAILPCAHCTHRTLNTSDDTERNSIMDCMLMLLYFVCIISCYANFFSSYTYAYVSSRWKYAPHSDNSFITSYDISLHRLRGRKLLRLRWTHTEKKGKERIHWGKFVFILHETATIDESAAVHCVHLYVGNFRIDTHSSHSVSDREHVNAKTDWVAFTFLCVRKIKCVQRNFRVCSICQCSHTHTYTRNIFDRWNLGGIPAESKFIRIHMLFGW